MVAARCHQDPSVWPLALRLSAGCSVLSSWQEDVQGPEGKQLVWPKPQYVLRRGGQGCSSSSGK